MGNDIMAGKDDNTNKQNPEWPREISIQQTYETAAAELGDAYNPDDDDAVSIAMGESRDALEIHSWDELRIPEGYEIVNEDDQDAYDAYLESKQRRRPEHREQGRQLIEAMEGHEEETVGKLIKAHPELFDVMTEDGWTPLHWAAFHGRKGLVELLLSKGADVNAKNNNNETPIYLATNCGHKDVAELLMAKGGNFNGNSNGGMTWLHWAAFTGNADFVKLAKDGDVDSKTNQGATPLHWAARYDYKDLAELFLGKGADVNAENDDDETPLHLLTEYGSKAFADLLLANGADINAIDVDGSTPLHRAVGPMSDKNLIELLIVKGANINARNNHCETPLRLAVKAGLADIAAILRSHGAKE